MRKPDHSSPTSRSAEQTVRGRKRAQALAAKGNRVMMCYGIAEYRGEGMACVFPFQKIGGRGKDRNERIFERPRIPEN